MRFVVMGVALLLACGPALAADDKPDKKDLTPAEEYKALAADYEKEQQEVYKLIREAKTDADKQKVYDEKMPKPEKVAKRLLELAEQNPKDEGVVPDALIWVVECSGSGVDSAKSKERALDLLLSHADDKKVAYLCGRLVYTPSRKNEQFIRVVVEKSTKDEAKGKATYFLGSYIKKTADAAASFKEKPETAKQYETAYGKEAAKYVQDSNPATMTMEAEALFERVAEKYPDIKIFGEETLGDLAEGELFEMRNLAIGQRAPEIESEDLDGNKFKLSEYRGKVVVIDFWGNW